jgi:hypothetical protein
MDIMAAVQYPFEDEEWTSKVGLGVLISMVPILNFAASGYMVTVIRSVAHNEPRPLPRWENLGDLLLKGLYLVIAQIAYFFVPMLLLAAVTMPLYILPLLGAGDEDVMAALGAVALMGLICVGLIALVISIALSLLLLAGIIRFSVGRQELAELFDFRGNFGYLRAHISTILMAILYLLLVGMVIGTVIFCVGAVLSFIPICGPLISMVISLGVAFFAILLSGHLYGQVARETGLVGPATPAV